MKREEVAARRCQRLAIGADNFGSPIGSINLQLSERGQIPVIGFLIQRFVFQPKEQGRTQFGQNPPHGDNIRVEVLGIFKTVSQTGQGRPEGQRIDAQISIIEIKLVALQIGLESLEQPVVGFKSRFQAFLLLGPLPGVIPHILVDAAQGANRFGIGGVGLEQVFQFDDGIFHPAQPVEQNGFLAAELQVARVEFETFLVLFQAKVKALQILQGSAGLANRFFFDHWVGDFFGQQKNVANPLAAARHGDAVFPFVVLTPKAGGQRRAQGVSFRLKQTGQEIKNRAVNRIRVRGPGIAANARNRLFILFEGFRVRQPLGSDMIRDGANVENVERHVRAPGLDVNHAAFPESVTNAQFVESVGVIDTQIAEHQVGQKQFLKHIRQNITAGG